VGVEGSSVLSGYRDEARRHVPDRQFYSQNRDGYKVQGCGRRGGGSEVWLYQGVVRVRGQV